MAPKDPSHSDFDLLVLGDCNPDLVLAGEQVQPAFGQVERLVDAADLTIGGSAAILACGAARLGLRTALIAVIGDDLFGSFMREALAERGVDTRGIVVDPAARTGITVILSRPSDRAVLTFPGTISALAADRVDTSLLAGTRHVHVASYFLQSSLAPSLPELFREAHRAGATTSVDPNWDPDELWDSGIRDLLELTDVFLPNAQEARRIADRDDPLAAAQTLAACGPLVAVKLGADGALAAHAQGDPVAVGSLAAVEPVDTTGAGDSFGAGLLTALLSGWSTERALSLGCACGTLSTRAIGGTTAQPTLAEALVALQALCPAEGTG
jgi:sugar/nucleoside kinase (ribokinase family)